MRRDVFQAIADPTRRSILGLLAQQAMTPNELEAHFEMSRQAISKHLRILTECQLSTPVQAGRENRYHFNPDRLQDVADFVEPFRKMWAAKYAQLDQVLLNIEAKTP